MPSIRQPQLELTSGSIMKAAGACTSFSPHDELMGAELCQDVLGRRGVCAHVAHGRARVTRGSLFCSFDGYL